MSTPPPDPDQIQRILYLTPAVHVYALPPLTSTKGYTAATWTSNNNARRIFTARLRVIETSLPPPTSPPPAYTPNPPKTKKAAAAAAPHAPPPPPVPQPNLKIDLRLEDPTTGELFAAAPYTSPGSVEAALDSSRFFVLRVADEGGRSAVLGIGFEERGEAIDFGICLQGCRRGLGFERGSGVGVGVGGSAGVGRGGEGGEGGGGERKDWSLKEGEMVKVDIGGRGRRRREEGGEGEMGGGFGKGGGEKGAVFSFLPPPPPPAEGVGVGKGGGGIPLLAPPPSARGAREEKKREAEREMVEGGFDDGEFGEFQ